MTDDEDPGDNPAVVLDSESPQTASQRVQVTTRVAVSQFSGPLPSPEILQAYDDIMPGAAERILRKGCQCLTPFIFDSNDLAGLV